MSNSNNSCVLCERKNRRSDTMSKQSITTDGCIINSMLTKQQCLKCGLFFNPRKQKLVDYSGVVATQSLIF